MCYVIRNILPFNAKRSISIKKVCKGPEHIRENIFCQGFVSFCLLSLLALPHKAVLRGNIISSWQQFVVTCLNRNKD